MKNFNDTPQAISSFPAFEQTLWRRARTPLAGLSVIVWVRTTDSLPLDLRRMMDAPWQYFLQAAGENEIAGAPLWLDEGDYPNNSTAAAGFVARVICGPVAGGARSNPLAATLRGRRVSRIAVHPARQRGRHRAATYCWCFATYAADLDYLSVSWLHRGVMAFLALPRFCAGAGWVIIVKPAVAIRRWRRCYR